jgi:hypothetical protein
MNSTVRRILAATWNWWTAAGLVVLLALAVGPRLSAPNFAQGVAQKVSVQSANGAPLAGHAGDALAAPSLKLNAPKTGQQTEIQTTPKRSNPRHRQIARTASLSLIAGDVDRTIAALTALVHQVDGDVVKLDNERPADSSDQHTADATIIVPADRFESTLARIAKLGGVRSQKVSAEDVGDQIVDDQARLRNLRRTESDMLAIMDRSGKIGEVLAVEEQLATVREQIEKLDAESQALSARVATSTIEIHLEDEARVTAAEPNAGSQLSNAWHSAWHDSRDAALALAGRIFVLIAFAPYWLPLIGIIALIVIQARRRLHA